MATSATFIRALAAGLVRYRPPRPLAEPKRHILITREVREILDGSVYSHCFPHYSAVAVMGKFVAGHFLYVSRHRATKVDLEQIENVDEVWALCFRMPVPGWRLFGRFLEHNTFVGLRLFDRHLLGGYRYEENAKTAIQLWTNVLGNLRPLRGASVAAYLSEPFRDVDETE